MAEEYVVYFEDLLDRRYAYGWKAASVAVKRLWSIISFVFCNLASDGALVFRQSVSVTDHKVWSDKVGFMSSRISASED